MARLLRTYQIIFFWISRHAPHPVTLSIFCKAVGKFFSGACLRSIEYHDVSSLERKSKWEKANLAMILELLKVNKVTYARSKFLPLSLQPDLKSKQKLMYSPKVYQRETYLSGNALFRTLYKVFHLYFFKCNILARGQTAKHRTGKTHTSIQHTVGIWEFGPSTATRNLCLPINFSAA